MKIVVEVTERNLNYGEKRRRPDLALFCGDRMFLTPDGEEDGPAICVLEYQGDDDDGSPRLSLSLWTEGM